MRVFGTGATGTTALNTVVSAVSRAGLYRPQGLPAYTLPSDALAMGASLGNCAIWVTTLGIGHVQHVFDVRSGEILLNAVTIRVAVRGT